MASAHADDGSEDVADFLERIKELGDKRQKEDEERARKLEEEILQGRKERQARRAERARSISPTKDSPLASSVSSLTSVSVTPVDRTHTPTMSRSRREKSPPATVDAGSPIMEPSKPHPPSSSSLSRSGTLSWQQRPTSRGSGSHARSLSKLAVENIAKSPRPSPTPEPSTEDRELSMSEKAQALQSKDPAWFRQTADRGANSAAYRRNQDSAQSPSGSIRLPGLSRESSIEPDNMSVQSRNSPRPETLSVSQHPSAGRTTPSISGRSDAGRSPFPMSPSQTFVPPTRDTMASNTAEERSSDRSPTMSPSQGRISPERFERPASPTKGLGGFVQSAMLKRSDSVNKRLSQQPAPGLVRGNSTANNRGSSTSANKPSALRGDDTREDTQATMATSRPSSRLSSRPSSSHSNATVTGTQSLKDGGFVRPAAPAKRDSQKSDNGLSLKTSSEHLPVEYSKTMDSRRFSPTKSSWLEAAINRPDSPSKQKPSTPKQPAWMENIAKARQARGQSIDMSKPVAHKEVSIGGLLRSPTMGHTTQSLSRPQSPNRASVLLAASDMPVFSPHVAETASNASAVKAEPVQQEPVARLGDDQVLEDTVSAAPADTHELSSSKRKEPAVTVPAESPVAPKPKPETPPNKDFRSSLKARNPATGSKQSDEPEFKKAFGTLRRAETKNYVAPDELKNNILRGKSGLNTTGGPKKTERVDEFKDSILKKKSEFEGGKSALITGSFLSKSKTEGEKPAVPEALAKRQLMGSRGQASPSTNIKPLESEKPEVPEALAKRQRMASQGQSTLSSSTKLVRPLRSGTMPDTASSEPLEKKTSAPDRLQAASPPSSSALADRFNPGLVGIIGRRPTPMSNTAAAGQAPTKVVDDTSSGAGPELTHATKSRARGPKRRAPKSTPVAQQDGGSSSTKSEKVESQPAIEAEPSTPKPISGTVGNTRVQTSPKPTVAPKPTTESKPVSEQKDAVSPTLSKVASKTPPATKPKRIASLQKLATNESSTAGLGMSSSAESSPTTSPRVPRALPQTPKSPPIPGKKPNSIPGPSATPTRPTQPQKASTSEAAIVFENFFKDRPGSIKGKVDIDTQAIIDSSSVTPSKIKTLRKEMWQVTGDGKKISIPAQYEHVLFEESMYLCSHVFGSAGGKRMTMVYLWCGDGVATSAIDDAQLFCRAAAKEAGGSLTLIHQGKEPHSFFDALGGIVITRRGSADTGLVNMSSSSYMLCGRHHMGQIAFDEVPFSSTSLCSGFPFLVATSSGRLYLWKGKGSTVDEMGCARLVGMDLGTSGEIEEIDEGSEPASFWNLFEGRGKPTSMSVDWSIKASTDKYRTRLFRVDADQRPKSSGGIMGWGRRGSTPAPESSGSAQIKEISPYAQQDLIQDTIAVLDTFYKVIVIVPRSATSKLASFRTALFFAQEYSMLTASLEDRPFIPAGVVEMGEASADLRWAFRKWDESKTPLQARSLSLGLNEALSAM